MIYYGDELYHHGVLGMKWGVRRYQNPDGTLTPAGKRRMLSVEKKLSKAANNENTRYDRYGSYVRLNPMSSDFRKQNKELIKNIKSDEKKKNIDEESKARLAENRKIYLSRMNSYVDNLFKEIGKESSVGAKQLYKTSINNPNKFSLDRKTRAAASLYIASNQVFRRVLPSAGLVSTAAYLAGDSVLRKKTYEKFKKSDENEYAF